MNDLVFRMIALALLGAMKVIRWRTCQRADLEGSREALKKNLADTLLLYPIGILIQMSIVVYALFPSWVSWAQLSFDPWARWAGLILAIVALCLLAWSDHHLGKEFSATLRIRVDHRLVTSGPYRWIRHPIYTAGLLFGAGIFLVSANGFVGVSWLGGCGVLYSRRIPAEEAMMLGEFADTYRDYMARTGRLLPRWFQ